METMFKKTLEKRLKNIHKIIKKGPSGSQSRPEIFENLPMLFAVLTEKKGGRGGHAEIFPFKLKKQKKYTDEIKTKLKIIKNYLHFSRDSQT